MASTRDVWVGDHDIWVVPVDKFMRIGAADLTFDAPEPTAHFIQTRLPGWRTVLTNVDVEKKEITVGYFNESKVEMTLEQFRKAFKLEPREVGPDVRCDVCHVKAPRVFGYDHVRMPRHSDVDPALWPHPYIPDLVVRAVGWAKFFFPWPEPWPANTLMPEHKNLCPRCAEKTAGYVAHLTKPPLDESDL